MTTTTTKLTHAGEWSLLEMLVSARAAITLKGRDLAYARRLATRGLVVAVRDYTYSATSAGSAAVARDVL